MSPSPSNLVGFSRAGSPVSVSLGMYEEVRDKIFEMQDTRYGVRVDIENAEMIFVLTQCKGGIIYERNS
jgi:hypothetical protein